MLKSCIIYSIIVKMNWSFLFLCPVWFVINANPTIAFSTLTQKYYKRDVVASSHHHDEYYCLYAKKQKSPIEQLESEGYDIPKQLQNPLLFDDTNNQNNKNFPSKEEVIRQFQNDGIELKQETTVPVQTDKKKGTTKTPTFGLKIDQDVASASELSDVLDQLKEGTNPLIKMQATMKMKKIETMQTLKDAQTTVERTTDEILMIPYRIVQTYETTKRKAQETVKTIQSTPDIIQGKANEVADEVQKTKQNIVTTIQDIQGIPSKVEQKIQDIQAIPDKVKTSVDETKQKIDSTKKAVDSAITGAANLGKFITSSTQKVITFAGKMAKIPSNDDESNSRTISLDDEVEAALKLAEQAIEEASKPSKS